MLGQAKRVRARTAPAAPSRSAQAGSSSTHASARASAPASSGGTRSPVSPSTTASGIPSTRVATTGRPLAIASRQTSGNPSQREGTTTTAAPPVDRPHPLAIDRAEEVNLPADPAPLGQRTQRRFVGSVSGEQQVDAARADGLEPRSRFDRDIESFLAGEAPGSQQIGPGMGGRSGARKDLDVHPVLHHGETIPDFRGEATGSRHQRLGTGGDGRRPPQEVTEHPGMGGEAAARLPTLEAHHDRPLSGGQERPRRVRRDRQRQDDVGVLPQEGGEPGEGAGERQDEIELPAQVPGATRELGHCELQPGGGFPTAAEANTRAMDQRHRMAARLETLGEGFGDPTNPAIFAETRAEDRDFHVGGHRLGSAASSWFQNSCSSSSQLATLVAEWQL